MKRFLKASTFLCVVVAMFAALLLKGGVAGAAGAPLVKQLNAVAAVSARNIWAVVYSISGSGEQPLIEHWNGTMWSIVPAPDPNPGPNAYDVWAVGNFTDSNGNLQPLIEHWNGRQWSIVANAQLPTGFDGGVLSGIEEVSAHNIWALGSPLGSGPSFTEHWDGKRWSIVAIPHPTGSVLSTLFGIAEVSAHDVWTVGYYIGNRDIDRTLIEHWDGMTWSIIPSPNSGPNNEDSLSGVVAISAHDVWAVGTIISTGSTPGQSLIEHWDGVQWRIVPIAS